jgi:hypothetical protein
LLKDPSLRLRGSFCLAAFLAVLGAVAVLASSQCELARATASVRSVQCPSVPWWPCQGIAMLELASTGLQAQAVVDALRLNSRGHEAALENVALDFLLIPAYVAFLALLGASVARLAELMKWNRLRRVLVSVAVLQPVAGILDGFENVGLLAMLLSGKVTQCVHAWTLAVSTAKWWLIGFGFVVPLASLLAILVWAALKRGPLSTRA